MKPLLVLARIIFVGCLWSIIFIEGIRVVMLENWHFDIFWPPHWIHAWNLWSAGWVIDTAKEWAFILIIFTFIPLWLTGWIGLSLIPWEVWFIKLVMMPVNFVRSFFNPLKIVTKTPVIVKKKSYKEIRPTGPRTPIYDYNNESTPAAKPANTPFSVPTPQAPKPLDTPTVSSSSQSRDSLKKKATDARETFSHSLFNLDDDDDDFELDFDSFGKSDIFSMDNDKNKKNSEKKEDKRNNRYSFDDDDDDDDYKKDSKSRRRDDDEEDYQPRRKKYDDDDDEDYKPRRKKYDEDDDGDYKPRRREDKKENRESKKEYRKDESKSPKSKQDNKSQRETDIQTARGNPVNDVLNQKGYKVLNSVTIKNTLIDFMGVSDSKICLCLVDKEPGDWLADEERFNDEEPLWFSENSHRISPVRKVDVARQALISKLEGSDMDFEVKAYVIIQMGNIINAEDMFEIWDELNVDVTRINRGMPKEIKLFSKTLEEAEGTPDKGQFESIKKLVRNL